MIYRIDRGEKKVELLFLRECDKVRITHINVYIDSKKKGRGRLTPMPFFVNSFSSLHKMYYRQLNFEEKSRLIFLSILMIVRQDLKLIFFEPLLNQPALLWALHGTILSFTPCTPSHWWINTTNVIFSLIK